MTFSRHLFRIEAIKGIWVEAIRFIRRIQSELDVGEILVLLSTESIDSALHIMPVERAFLWQRHINHIVG